MGKRKATAEEGGEETEGKAKATGAPAVIEPGEIPTELIEAGYDEEAVYRDKSGNPFWLREVPPGEVDRGKTHQLKNKTHFWEGSEEEFRLQFTKD